MPGMLVPLHSGGLIRLYWTLSIFLVVAVASRCWPDSISQSPIVGLDLSLDYGLGYITAFGPRIIADDDTERV